MAELRLPRLVRRFIYLCRSRLARRGNALIYRIAGLPTALRYHRRTDSNPAAAVRRAYARWYWHPQTSAEGLDLGLALLLWPLAFLGLAVLFLWRNGRSIVVQSGRSVWRQLLDQTWLYAMAGVLPSCYYTYGLHERPLKRHARGFLLRCETKGGLYRLINRGSSAILWDKTTFAEHCGAKGIVTVPTLAVVGKGQVIPMCEPEAFRTDLFVKPVKGKGGRGAQRWRYLGADRYEDNLGRTLNRQQLFEFLLAKSAKRKLLVQPCLAIHPDLAPISNGALSTVRVLTCLDEKGRPEVISAMLRMAIGPDRIVDNAHKGGIAAPVDLATGALGEASEFGANVTRLSRHPTSGARITGVRLPYWDQVGALVLNAHSSLPDRMLVGWDVAVTRDGAVLIEANGSPGLEMMQRVHRRGFIRERLGQLLAHHLRSPMPVTLAA